MLESYRQGDVLILKVDRLPEEVTEVPTDRGRNILAYGEVTGHSHALLEKDCSLVETKNGERYLSVPIEAPLRHEEHTTIVLPAGDYRIIQQKEYQREFRTVVD